MEQSTYYELNLMEGSDTFNPLTIDRPNFESIDEIMHDNAINGVTRADHTKSASVHEIVRDNSDAPVIRFVATADFLANDTFTVDEVQVSAFNTAGEPLGSGAFKTGASVLCILVGTTLTVLTNGVVANADNANKLNGEEASYYGKQSDLTAVQTLANATKIIAEANQAAINDARPVTLWTNPNPTSQFAEQDITLSDSLTNYDYYELLCKVSDGSNNLISSGKIDSNFGARMEIHNINSIYRDFNRISATKIHAGAGSVLDNYGTYPYSTRNTNIIPYKIIGYKSF